MITILNSWEDVGKSIGYLTEIGKDKRTRIYHSTPVKNWDLAQIARLLRNKGRNCAILDMGCGGSSVLRFCHKNGFNNCYGVDLTINFHDRWQQLMYWKNNKFILPYHLSAKSVTQTGFQNNFFDVLICLSVIEHGVPLEEFLKESARILKPGGILYISTDYHEIKIYTNHAPLNYESKAGDWKIYSKKEISELILKANSCGLVMKQTVIPKMKQPIVKWNTKEYTFISLLFQKGSLK